MGRNDLQGQAGRQSIGNAQVTDLSRRSDSRSQQTGSMDGRGNHVNVNVTARSDGAVEEGFSILSGLSCILSYVHVCNRCLL